MRAGRFHQAVILVGNQLGNDDAGAGALAGHAVELQLVVAP